MWKRSVLFLALLALSTAVQAAPVNFYLGASLGNSADVETGTLGFFGAESDDQTWKAFAGIGIGRIFGIEAAWHNFGTTVCCEGLADAGFEVDTNGVSIAAVVGIPLSRLRLFAKAGLFSWEADGFLLSIAGPSPFSADGADPMGGVGADLSLGDHLSVRAEWELFSVEEVGIDLFSVGVQYRF